MHFFTPKPDAQRWALYIFAGSFLFALLIGMTGAEINAPADLLHEGHLLAIGIYTVIFAVPILSILLLVNWLERKA